ncbi:MAG TPA: flagellar basal body-associated FliL family protein [Spongiibacteraceae bacterium]|jgi:flagellar FliL protein
MRLFIIRLLLISIAVITGAYASEEAEGEKASVSSEYFEIKPALITNYGGPGPIHFLKVEISLRLDKDAEASSLVMHHMPHIRHELVMLFSRQSEDNLATMQGKEQLRQDALSAVQKVLETEEHKKLVGDLLFTNFVIQH